MDSPSAPSDSQRTIGPPARQGYDAARRCWLGGALSASALLGLAAVCVPACGGLTSIGPSAVAIMPGVINRTDNKALRFSLLKFGLDEFCKELLERGAPLKMAADQPSMGRFFPTQCEQHILDDDTNKSFLVQFAGVGYAWTNVTHRVAFEATGVVEYSPDFALDGSTMYVYFRTKRIASTSFKTTLVEGAAANLVSLLAPAGLADQVGSELVSGELARGFTVLRDGNGQVDFGLGLLDRGQKPRHPYEARGSERAMLANDRAEVHAGQREFLGPFKLESDSQAVYITVSIDGVPAVDAFVLPRDSASAWLSTYLHTAATTPPPYPPLMQEVVPAGGTWRRGLPLSKGQYYLVIDNTSTAGRVAPPGEPLEDRAALVSYALELGDAP